jgi:hypothetical protein
MGRPPKLTPHRQREAIQRRDRGDESLSVRFLDRLME